MAVDDKIKISFHFSKKKKKIEEITGVYSDLSKMPWEQESTGP